MGGHRIISPPQEMMIKGAVAIAFAAGFKTTHCAADGASWLRNTIFRPPSGFWGDAEWYDLQMERRLPATATLLAELVFALPPLATSRVADLGAGSGRVSAAIQSAYPRAHLPLVDVDEERGARGLRLLKSLR